MQDLSIFNTKSIKQQIDQILHDIILDCGKEDLKLHKLCESNDFSDETL